jgi:hypothetical protein
MSDTVYAAFLSDVASQAPRLLRESRALAQLAPIPRSGDPPAAYLGVLRGIEHLERAEGGTVCASSRPVPFVINFPADYLRSVDDTLQFRVARANAPLYHPNCRRDGTLCLGPGFLPGTALRPLLETIYGIVSSRVIATEHAFDKAARDYFVAHVDQIRDLRDKALPLWGRRLAASVRAESLDPSERRAGARS